MFKINEIQTGKSYACKFKCETMLDENNKPITNPDTPLKGPGIYESIGIIQLRDNEKQLVKLVDKITKREFIIPYDNIWDIDEVEWISN